MMLLKEERGANDASENSLFSLLSSLFSLLSSLFSLRGGAGGRESANRAGEHKSAGGPAVGRGADGAGESRRGEQANRPYKS